MKRMISIVLVLLMTLSLCACGSSGETQQTQSPDTGMSDGLNIGYAKVSITPNYTVGMGGYADSETRLTQGFIDYIYTTCIAATSGGETILIYTVDTISVNHENAEAIRKVVTEATGIPGEKIFIGATHAHNCPALSEYDGVEKYREDFFENCAEAAKKALEDRSPATILRAKAEHEGMNFVRHYTLPDGTNVGNNELAGRSPVGHPMPSDNQMVMLKFDRGEDKKDILMVNWQSHPDKAKDIGYNLISPSWIGPMRNKLEQETGMHVAYFTGASGNQVPDSKIKEEANNLGWEAYGEKLADCAATMLNKLEPVESTDIKTVRYMMPVKVDHSWDHMLEQANEVYDLWKSVSEAAGDALGKTYGFTSSFQARAIRYRAAMGETIDMEMNAFSIGEIGFTTGTYEMFSDNGLYVKENSPFETTFIIAGCATYVASDIAFTYRNYEADTSWYVPGTGEQLAEKYVELLGQVK